MCEKFRNLPSLAARSWVFQACPGEQRMVESSLPVCLVLIRVKHAGGEGALCISTHLQLSAGPHVENRINPIPGAVVLGLPIERMSSLK